MHPTRATEHLIYRFPGQPFTFTPTDNHLTINWEDGLATNLVKEYLDTHLPTLDYSLNRTMSKAFERAVVDWCQLQTSSKGWKGVDLSDPILYPYPVKETPWDGRLECNYRLLPTDIPGLVFPQLTVSYGGANVGGFVTYRLKVRDGQLWVNGEPADDHFHRVPAHAKNRVFLALATTRVYFSDSMSGLVKLTWDMKDAPNHDYRYTGVKFSLNPEVLAENPDFEGETKFIVAVGYETRKGRD